MNLGLSTKGCNLILETTAPEDYYRNANTRLGNTHEFRSIIGVAKKNQKRTCGRISKSGTGDKDDHREQAKVVRTCQEKRRRVYAKKNVRCTSTRKETETKADIQVERLV